MADYSAKIRLELENEGVLKRLQNRLDEINETIDSIQKLNLKRVMPPQGGRFMRNPNKEALADAQELAQQLKDGINITKDAIKVDNDRAEALKKQLRLNNAIELFERRRTALTRSGADEVKSRAKNIQAIEERFKLGLERNDVALIREAATGLGRILETQRELNRTAKSKAALQSDVSAFNKRIEQLKTIGVTEGRLSEVTKLRDKLNSQIDKREIDRARITEAALKRKLELLEEQNKLVKGVGATSPVSGRIGAGPVAPGSPADIARTSKASASWTRFFADAAEAAVALKAKSINTQTAWSNFFEDASEVTGALKSKALNTQTSWNRFFEDASEVTATLKARALNTQAAWSRFFEDASEVAATLKARALNTQISWSRFFEDAAETALTLKLNRLNTQKTWVQFFEDAAEAAQTLKLKALNTRTSWEKFFKDAQGVRESVAKSGGGAKGATKGGGRFSNAVLGAGFPLLFGGGPGAVLGGAIGGAAVGGPAALAAQIGLSALGQQLDTIAGSTLNTAKSLTSTSKAFELLQEKTLFSSEAAAEKAIQLEAEGKAAELAALLSEELANALGNKAAQSLLDLGKTTDETTRLWNQLTLQLQTLLAGPLNGLLKFVNSLLSQLSKDLRFRELSKDLAGDAEFQAAVQARRGGGKTGVLSSADKAELLELFKGRVVNTVQIPVTAADRRLIAPPSAKSAPKGPKDRTAQLLADLKAVEAISDFENQIRDAQFEYNDLKVIDLQYKKAAADIERDATKQLINANFETEKAAILQIKNAKLRDAELKKLDDIRQLQRDITDEYFRRAGLDTQFLIQREGAGAFDTTLDLDPNDKKIQAVDNLREKLKDLADPINVAVRGAESIGSAFNTAFNDLISGTTSAQEVLSNFFKSVGDSFVDLAGQIISQLLVISAFKALAGIFGAAGGSLFSGAGPVSLPSGDGFTGAFLQGVSSGPIAFAEGGYVTSPTRAIIGEGGEPEYVIPFSKMGSAAANFAAGARGEDVFGPLRSTSVPFSKTTERMMSERSERETVAALNNPDPLDVRFNSQVINNVEYVTAEEYRKGMTQAAERGRTLTLAALQNSVKTRKRVGIG